MERYHFKVSLLGACDTGSILSPRRNQSSGLFQERKLQAPEFTVVNEERSNVAFCQDRPKAALCHSLLESVAQFFLAGLILSATGCSLFFKGHQSQTTEQLNRQLLAEEIERKELAQQSVPQTSLAHYNFMLGELALEDEKFDEAQRYFEEAAKYESSSAPTLRRRLAQVYLRSGKLEEALQQLDLALARDPSNVDLLKMRAGILATLKKVDSAVETYEKIIALEDSDNEDAYIFAASLLAQESKTEKAKEILQRLLAKKPNSFFGVYYLAKVSLVGGDYAEAEKLYLKALQLTPDAESVQLELARAYALQKRFSEAIAVCEDVVKKNPTSVKGRALLGELLLVKDRVDEAIKEYEALGALEQDPSETRLKIGLIKLQRKDLEGAEVELRLVLSQHPDNYSARYYLASTYAGMNRMQDAVKQLEMIPPSHELFTESRMLAVYILRQLEDHNKALKLLDELLEQKPNNVKLLIIKASIERDGKKLDAAIQTAKKVVELKPEDDLNYFTLGVYYDEAKQRDKALEVMLKAIELNPKNANALNYIGYSWAEAGENLTQAESYIKRALEIEPRNGYFIDSLGWVYYKMKRFDDAYRELKLAVELANDDAVIMEHFARVLLKLNRQKEAKEILEKALPIAPDSEDPESGDRIKTLLNELGAADQ